MAAGWGGGNCSGIGGYDIILVEQRQEIWYKYLCVICRLIPRSVHQVNCCGKFMCHQCYEVHRSKNGDRCPVCRNSLLHKVFHDTNRQQEILSLRVYCYNKEHGCAWSGELMNLEKYHIKECTYKLVTCDKCREKVPESIMGEHQADNCRKRSYKCPYCHKVGIYDDINYNHLAECPECPVECPNNNRGCLAKMKRKEIPDHRKVCNYELVSCRYQALGCNIMSTRFERQTHELMCPKKPHEEPNPLQDQQLLQVRQNVLPLHIQIDKFHSRWENKEVWQQDFFTAQNGYYMCLKVHLDKDSNNYLSCYIHLKAGPYDDTLAWPFKGIFEIELQNQKEDKNHYMREIKFLTSAMVTYNSRSMITCNMSECQLGYGEPQYIKHCDLSEGRLRPNCNYIQDDTVMLRVSVKSADSCNRFWPFGGYR